LAGRAPSSRPTRPAATATPRQAAEDRLRALLAGRSLDDLHADVQRELAGRSLKHFMRQAWPIIEPSAFVDSWHIDAIVDALSAVKAGTLGSQHLIFNVPPRHSKSLTVEVMFPAWMWIDRPSTRFLCSSYAEDLSIRDSIKCRSIIQSSWYQRNWADRYKLSGDQNAKTRFNTDKGGYRLATSVGGMTTGEGGDIILVDDPHNVLDSAAVSERGLENVLDWWDLVMPTRLNDPKTGIYIIIMQRCHTRDLTGHILSRELDAVHICLPAEYEAKHPHKWVHDPRKTEGELLCPQRFGAKEVDGLKRKLGTFGASGQLQQRPAPREGGMVKDYWFKLAPAAPAVVKTRQRFWDRAATEKKKSNDPDWTAGARVSVTADGLTYIEDIAFLRDTSLMNQRAIKQTAELDGIGVPIWMEQEPGSSGVDTISTYSREVLQGFSFRGKRSTGSKEVFIDILAAQAEAGNVYLVGDAETPWIKLFLEQVRQWPLGSHDDLFEAAAKAYCNMTTRPTARVREVYTEAAPVEQLSADDAVIARGAAGATIEDGEEVDFEAVAEANARRIYGDAVVDNWAEHAARGID